MSELGLPILTMKDLESLEAYAARMRKQNAGEGNSSGAERWKKQLAVLALAKIGLTVGEKT